MKAAPHWRWAGRREVWLRLHHARLFDAERRMYLASRAYRARFETLAGSLANVHRPITPELAARELGLLFRDLVATSQRLHERGYVPPDVEWSQQEAARWLAGARSVAEEQTQSMESPGL